LIKEFFDGTNVRCEKRNTVRIRWSERVRKHNPGSDHTIRTSNGIDNRM